MKFVRKSIALLLALVMVLALSTAAFAAPVTEMQGVTLNYGIPSAYQFVRNNEAGAITKTLGIQDFITAYRGAPTFAPIANGLSLSSFPITTRWTELIGQQAIP